jgi:hypothetical protein
LISFDVPFGLDMAPGGWDSPDKVLSEDDLYRIFQQTEAINSSRATVCIVTHHRHHCERYEKAVARVGFVDHTSFVWCKEGHNAVGSSKRYVFAIELQTISYKPGVEECPCNLSQNPLERHNYIIGKAQKGKVKSSTDGSTAVNPHEKPPWLMQELVRRHCTPGGMVLIIGGGAGGEVVGAMRAGCDVIVVERDATQYHSLLATLVAEARALFAALSTSKEPRADVLLGEGSDDDDDNEEQNQEEELSEVEEIEDEPVEEKQVGVCHICKGPCTKIDSQECPLCDVLHHIEQCSYTPSETEIFALAEMMGDAVLGVICDAACPKLVEQVALCNANDEHVEENKSV